MASLDAKPKYETISYAWGDHNVLRSVKVNGCLARVTLNLHSALRHLRLRTRPRILWADALCINQGDDDEKTVQVGMMAEVYSHCQGVLVRIDGHNYFLDLPKDDYWVDVNRQARNLSPFKIIRMLAADRHLDDILSQCPPVTAPYVHVDVELDHHQRKWSVLSQALKHLIESQWWNRLWTAQETVLAPKATLIYGCEMQDWATLVDACDTFFRHETSCCKSKSESHPYSSDRELLWRLGNTVKNVETFRTQRLPHFAKDEILLHVLTVFRSRDTTEPRDKVYGLLGLCRSDRAQIPDAITPDYSLTTLQVYRQVVLHCIENDGHFGILQCRLCNAGTSLPSWIPNWELCDPQPDSQMPFDWQMWALYRATKNERSPPSRLFTSTVLTLRGFLHDTVVTTGHSLNRAPLDRETGADCCNIWEEWKNTINLPQCQWDNYAGGGTLKDAFWRTTVLNTYGNYTGHELRICSQQGHHRWKRGVAAFRFESRLSSSEYIGKWQSTPWHRYHKALYHTHAQTACNQRFFVTQKGYIGLGPTGTAVGDEVFLLVGGSSPFILRPDEGSTIPQDVPFIKIHKLLGPAYVHGIMDGEAMRDDPDTWEDVHLG